MSLELAVGSCVPGTASPKVRSGILSLNRGVDLLRGDRPMTSSDHSRYRGYQLRPQRQWSSWCVGIYPTRADLPLLARSILDTLSPRKNEAIEEAKEAIDRALNEVGKSN